MRKQTLVNAERYITEELKTYETKILGAEEKIKALEQELYQQLLEQLQMHLATLKHNAQQLAHLDCLWSFAYTAQKFKYCCPEFTKGEKLTVVAGRHPVIEQQLPPEESLCAQRLVFGPQQSAVDDDHRSQHVRKICYFTPNRPNGVVSTNGELCPRGAITIGGN